MIAAPVMHIEHKHPHCIERESDVQESEQAIFEMLIAWHGNSFLPEPLIHGSAFSLYLIATIR